MNEIIDRNTSVYLFIGLIGIMAFVLMLWITPYGAGVSPDSIFYLGGAKNLLSGNGFSLSGDPITHYPPFYPLLLAATGLLRADLVQSARILNALLFGINAGLVALAVFLAVGRNVPAVAGAALFFLSSASLLEIHAMAWSEPLFITFTLGCMLLFSRYIVRPTLLLLVASSLCLGCAMVTRYSGLAFLPAAIGIVYIAGGDRPFGRRFSDTLVGGMLSCAPLAIVLARNMILGGSAANRSFVSHPLSVFYFVKQIIANLIHFIAPFSLPFGIKQAMLGLIAASFAALLVIFFKRHSGTIHWRSMGTAMALSCLLFSGVYVVFLFISISFFDAATPVDIRLLSPIFVPLVAVAFTLPLKVSQTMKNPAVWRCFILLAAVSIATKTPAAIHSVAYIQKNGLEYTSRQWRDSKIVEYVNMLGNEVRIYTNGADALGFLTGKRFQSMPAKMSFATSLVNPRYREDVAVMCKSITEEGALLVYVNQFAGRTWFPTETELVATFHLPVLHALADGTVYGKKR